MSSHDWDFTNSGSADQEEWISPWFPDDCSGLHCPPSTTTGSSLLREGTVDEIRAIFVDANYFLWKVMTKKKSGTLSGVSKTSKDKCPTYGELEAEYKENLGKPSFHSDVGEGFLDDGGGIIYAWDSRINFIENTSCWGYYQNPAVDNPAYTCEWDTAKEYYVASATIMETHTRELWMYCPDFQCPSNCHSSGGICVPDDGFQWEDDDMITVVPAVPGIPLVPPFPPGLLPPVEPGITPPGSRVDCVVTGRKDQCDPSIGNCVTRPDCTITDR